MPETTTPPEMRAAFEWLVRLQDDRRQPADLREFQAWLAADAGHRAAWAEANALWTGFEPLRGSLGQSRQEARAVSRRRLLTGIAALGVAGAVGWTVSRPGFGADVATAAGERREIALGTGATAMLGSRSALDLTPTGAALLRGEAHIEVAAGRSFELSLPHGPQPGLILRSGAARFMVRQGLRQTQIGVASHGLEVILPGNAPEYLVADQQMTLTAGAAPRKAAVDPADLAGWRAGRITFRGAPLREVLFEIERQRGGRIILLAGAATAETPVTAVFETSQPEAALTQIAAALSLSLTRLPGQVVLVNA